MRDRQGLTLAFALKANFVNRIFGRSPKKHPHRNEEITDEYSITIENIQDVRAPHMSLANTY